MIVIVNELGRYANYGSLLANRASERAAYRRFVLFHLLGLKAFGCSFFDIRSTTATSRTPYNAMQIVLVRGEIVYG